MAKALMQLTTMFPRRLRADRAIDVRGPGLPARFAPSAPDLSTECALRAALEVSERRALIGQLAAGTAHELNNPLAYISSNISFVLDQLNQVSADESSSSRVAECREALEETLAGIERVKQIARDLKDLSRVDEAPGGVDLGKALGFAARIALPTVRSKAQFVQEIPQDLPEVVGSEGRLSQVFLNLLINAAHAMPAGEARSHRICLRARAEPAQVVVEVEDDGIGMTPEVQRRLFEPFFTTKPAGVGTGLGLSICKAIVVAHRGSISFESAVGRGTTFRIALPRAEPANP